VYFQNSTPFDSITETPQNTKGSQLAALRFDQEILVPLLFLAVEPDQEFGVLGGQVELEDSFMDELVYRLARVLLDVCRHPFYCPSQVFSFR